MEHPTVWELGVADTPPVRGSLSTGSAALDRVLGGYPRGCSVRLVGPPASGKTSLALRAVASCQRGGGTALFVDAEHALDLAQVRRHGVDPTGLLYCRPPCGEQAFDTVEILVRSGGIDLVVVDSVAALLPRAELHRSLVASPAGAHASMVARGLRRLVPITARSGAVVLYVDQLRRVLPGGDALSYRASVCLELEPQRGATRVRVVKNRSGPVGRTAVLEPLRAVGAPRGAGRSG